MENSTEQKADKRRTIQQVHQTLRDDYGVTIPAAGRHRGKLVKASTGRPLTRRQFTAIAADMRAKGLQLVQPDQEVPADG